MFYFRYSERITQCASLLTPGISTYNIMTINAEDFVTRCYARIAVGRSARHNVTDRNLRPLFGAADDPEAEAELLAFERNFGQTVFFL